MDNHLNTVPVNWSLIEIWCCEKFHSSSNISDHAELCHCGTELPEKSARTKGLLERGGFKSKEKGNKDGDVKTKCSAGDPLKKQNEAVGQKIGISSFEQTVTSTVSEEIIFLSSQNKPKEDGESIGKNGKKVRSFRDNFALKEHKRNHTGENPEKIHTKEKPQNKTEDGELIDKNGRKVCSVCEKSFRDNFALKEHKRTHTGEKPFSCSFCDKKFRKSDKRKDHEKSHTREKPEKIHTGEKPQYKSKEDGERIDKNGSNVCSVCEKSFRDNFALKEHKRIHTGEKPFSCSFCDKKFRKSDKLKDHEKSHTGEKPFKCMYCPKSFGKSYHLKEHTNGHTGEKPFPCLFCDKSFGKSYHLKEHTSSHTGENPFPCQYCPKSFAKTYNLKIHTRIHTGEKPFLCLVCSEKFTTLTALNIHKKRCIVKKSSTSGGDRRGRGDRSGGDKRSGDESEAGPSRPDTSKRHRGEEKASSGNKGKSGKDKG